MSSIAKKTNFYNLWKFCIWKVYVISFYILWNVYVLDIDIDLALAEVFSEHFKNYGEITDSVIMKEKGTGRPRGFGFVTFANPSVVEKVLEDDHVIDGRMVCNPLTPNTKFTMYAEPKPLKDTDPDPSTLKPNYP